MGKPSAIGQTQPTFYPFAVDDGKLESDVCCCVYGWRHRVKATDVTTGLAESNDSLPLGGWLKVTCGLTACTPGSAPGPTLGNEYRNWENFTFTFNHVIAVVIVVVVTTTALLLKVILEYWK